MRHPGALAPFVLAGLLALAPLSAAAATRTWNGSASSSWASNSNWTPPAIPVAGDDLVFPANTMATPVYTFTSTNDLAAGTAFSSIAISESGYTISGNSISLSGGITATNASGSNSLQLGITLTASQFFFVSFLGTLLQVTGPVTISSGVTLTVSGSGNLDLTNVVQGGGGINKGGVGRLTLSGNNSYAGLTQINGGAVRIKNPNALGATATGTAVASGAALEIDSGMVFGFATSPAEPLTLNGVGIGGTGALVLVNDDEFVNWSGSIFLASTTTIGVSAPGATIVPILTISGVISGSGGLTILAPMGYIILESNNTYTGTTTIQLGVLTVQANGGLGSTSAGTVVESGGSLSFSGAIGAEHLTLNGDGVGGRGALRNINGSSGSWAGDVLLASESLVWPTNGSITLNGVVSENSAGLHLDFAGTPAGTLVLNGNNTYSATYIYEGTVLVNGSQPASAVTLEFVGAHAATLGGTGTVGAVTSTTNTGVVSPGASPGILTADSLSLSAGTTFRAELNGPTVGTDFDQLVVNNAIGLGNATLQVVPGYTPTPGTLFRIIRKVAAGAISGTFLGIAQGAYFAASGQEFQMNYLGGTGNDVVLKAIAPASTTVSPAGPTDLCANGGMILLTAQPPTGGSGSYSGYQWYKNLVFLPGATGTIYQATMPGSYTVRVTDSAGLTGPDSPASVVNQDGTAPVVTPPAASTTAQTVCQ